jgi:hypothetical protein
MHAYCVRYVCFLIFAISDCSHRTRVLRGFTATKVLVLDIELSGEFADRRWKLCSLRKTHASSYARRDNGARIVFGCDHHMS